MEIRPFKGWRYSTAGDVSSLIAPPYDVLSQQDKAELLARNPHNIVAVDLPHCPPYDAGPDETYARAAEILASWRSSGVLIREQRPALYAYEQRFSWSGRSYVRRGMICGVRGTPLGRDVLAHEQTRPGPKADRLKLTQHTRTQLSPVFGFYEDESGCAAEALWSAAVGPPAVRGELDAVQESLWVVTDADVIRNVVDCLARVPVFIADGHHRYTTALNYRDELLAAGAIDEDHEANFVMFVLVPRDDPGLLILPTHRLISGLASGFTLGALAETAEQFTWEKHDRDAIEDQLRDVGGWLSKFGRGAMAFIQSGSRDIWIARLRDQEAMRRAAPDQTEVWRQLDVAVLHTLIIDGALQPWRTERTQVEYSAQAADVLAAVQTGQATIGVFLQGTDITAVQAIARAGASMPPKSTYFYPKPVTGMVLKPLE